MPGTGSPVVVVPRCASRGAPSVRPRARFSLRSRTAIG